MNILITGGAGFIGSHTTESLLKQGYKVICIDNFNDYYDPRQKESNVKRFLNNKDYRLYRTDIRDLKDLRQVFSENKIDRIIHLAAMAGVRYSIANPELYHDVNINGLKNILRLANEFKIKNMVFASSSSVYGNSRNVPFTESDKDLKPISPYAKTKLDGEKLCQRYAKTHKMNITCLRFFTVYGPRGRPDMAPYKFTQKLLKGEPIEVYGDGTSKRDYTYVTDIVSGIVKAMDVKGFNIINLGNDNPTSLKYFISLIEKNAKKKFKIIRKAMQQGDVDSTHANITKARKILKYNPKIPIEKGIRNIVRWHKSKKI